MTYKNQLQTKLLEMFKVFHEFCIENQLTYIALGGTMLGAVRHQGFIPWDDDIDVGMPRKDFERLSELLKGKKMGKYLLETPQSIHLDYCYPYAKLYDTTTTMIENTRQKLVRGIFIDIFPLDGLGNTIEEAKRNFRLIKILNDRLLLKRTSVRSGRAWYKNLLIKCFGFIPLKSFNEKELCKRIDEICKSRDFFSFKFGGNLLGAWKFREVMPKSVIGEPQLYKFEDFEIYGPEYYDNYLTHLYGDWRKLPPREKQISHHDYYLDLLTPYDKYKE